MNPKLVFLIIMLIFSISACTRNQSAIATPTVVLETDGPAAVPSQRWLHFGLDTSSINTMDPHMAATRQERILVDMVFNGLVRYRPGNMPAIEPDLAVEIPEPVLENGRQVWSFQLRQGVMCQPGPLTDAYELTSEDVVYSLQRSADPNRSDYAGEYAGMTFEAIDRYRVSIILDSPLSIYLFLPKVENYAGGFILCKRAIEAMGDQAFGDHPVGTGPFQVQSYSPNSRVTLVSNPLYFRGQPRLAGVEANFLPELADREQGLADGTLDVIVGSNAPGWTEKWNPRQTTIDIIGVGQPIVLYFNPAFAPLEDMRVRKAIAYAIDRDEILALFNPLTAVNIYSIVPPEFLPGGLTKSEVNALGLDYAKDLEQARALLSEAGYSAGFSLPVISSRLEVLHKIYDNLRIQLADIGVDLQLETVPHNTWHEMIRTDESALVVYGGWRPNADVFLTSFFHSSSIVASGSSPDTNFSHYDRIDDLILGARNELNPNIQVQLWKQAQIKILTDMAALPLEYQNLVYVRRANVDYGYIPTASLSYYPQFTELTQIYP